MGNKTTNILFSFLSLFVWLRNNANLININMNKLLLANQTTKETHQIHLLFWLYIKKLFSNYAH